MLVVDDGGSADRSRQWATRRRCRSLVRRERGGPGAARNAGAAAAEGDAARVHRRRLPARPRLAARTAGAARAPGHDDRRPHAQRAPGQPATPTASQHIQDLVYAHYNRDPERARFFATNNVAVPRDDFLALGGFDVDGFPFASEDRDLCDRWRASGRGLRYGTGAVVRHAHDLDLRGFVRQHVAYGRGAARYHRRARRRGTGRLRDEAGFHLDASLWLQHRAAPTGETRGGHGAAARAVAGGQRGRLPARAAHG